jgi:two-component system NtrC family sensor kinase
MMKRLAFTLFLTINLRVGFSQNQKRIDSLKRELAIATQDTHGVSVMVELSSGYLLVRIDSALVYAEKAIALAQKIKSPKSEAIAFWRLGNVYRESGNLPKALKLINKALKFFEETKDFQEIATCKNILGLIYWDLKNFTKSLQYYHQAKSIYERLNSISGVARVQNNIGIAFTEMNQLDSAKYHLTQSYKNNIRLGSNGIYPLRNLASVEEKLGNHRSALEICARCLRINDSSDVRNTSLLNIIIAESYQAINKLDSAIFYANKGLELAKKGPYKKRMVDAYSILKEIYKSKGDFKLALKNEELLVAERDSLFGTSIRAVVSQEEENQIDIENNKKEYQNQLKVYFLLAGLAFMLLIGFILYRNNRQKHKANIVLEKTLSELKSTQTQLIQREKMASLGELAAGIAHEIQNPLNFVNNFSELNTELIEELDEEAGKGNTDEVRLLSQDIKQNLIKITHHGKRASNIVKGMLEHSRTSTGEKESTDLNVLTDEYLRLAYHGIQGKDQAFNYELVTNFAPNLPPANIVPQEIGRVLLNLFNNAFYAVGQKQKTAPLDYQPTVMVSTAQTGSYMEIRVKDNGTGIPDAVKAKVFQPFFTTKPTGEGTGLGLSLSYDIVTKGHGGTLAVTTKPGEFTEFSLVLPIA